MCLPQARRAASRFCYVSRPMHISHIHWPKFRLVRVSDGLTTSARCHASLPALASKLQIIALGKRTRCVVSRRSKCICWSVSSLSSIPSPYSNIYLVSKSEPLLWPGTRNCFSCSVIRSATASVRLAPAAPVQPLREVTQQWTVWECSVQIPNMDLHRRLSERCAEIPISVFADCQILRAVGLGSLCFRSGQKEFDLDSAKLRTTHAIATTRAHICRPIL
jgi:hypothetical protein